MLSIRLNPIASLSWYIAGLTTGRVRFPRHRIGRMIDVKGTDYEIVKEIDVIQAGAEEPEAIFTVKFHLANMSPAANKIFLNLPIPFFAGLPGFRHKLWLFDKNTGDFRGLYEWQTVEDARKYSKSFAVWFMKRRSVPGSVEYEIIEKSSGKTVEHGVP